MLLLTIILVCLVNLMDSIQHQKVKELVVKAGQNALRLKAEGLNIEYKDDGTPVTNADLANHEMICTEIRVIFPGMTIISEEDEDLDPSGKYTDACVTCPIDGTQDLIDGTADFAVLVGFVENGVPVHGFAYYPDTRRGVLYFTGQRDNKAYKQSVTIVEDKPVFGPPIELKTKVAPNNRSLRIYQFIVDARNHISSVCNVVNDYPSPTSVIAVLEGHLDLATGPNTMGDWDMIPIDAIARRAGAIFASLDDKNPFKYGQPPPPGHKPYKKGPYVLGNLLTLKEFGLLQESFKFPPTHQAR